VLTWLPIAGREPALLGVLLGIATRLLGVWLNLGGDAQALLNAATSALVGLLIASATHDGQSAALLGFAQALLALAVGFGLRLDADTQALLMSAVGLIAGMYTRTQVTALSPPTTDNLPSPGGRGKAQTVSGL
jgi:hypothetical protein